MISHDLLYNKTVLALVAAAGYGIATLLIKLIAETGVLWPLAGIGALLAATVVAEILLMRQIDLGLAYIIVIGAETLLVLAVAFLIGEALSVREMVGSAMVVAGIVVVSL